MSDEEEVALIEQHAPEMLAAYKALLTLAGVKEGKT